jgi:hypothetical protein
MDRTAWIALGGTLGVLGLVLGLTLATNDVRPGLPAYVAEVPSAAATPAQSPARKRGDFEPQSRETLFAKKLTPMYNGPSKASGRMWFSKRATKPMSASKGEAVYVTGRQGEWDQLDVFGKQAWVEDKLIGPRDDNDIDRERAERLHQFTDAESNGWPLLFRGMQGNSSQLTLYVSSQWERMSPDERSDWLQKALTVYLAMGANRQISENLEDYSVEVKHEGNWRVLATWAAGRGYSDKLQ